MWTFVVAWRRAKRRMVRHQGLSPPAARRRPMAVLLWGELLWVLERLRRSIVGGRRDGG